MMSNYWYDSGAEDELILETKHDKARLRRYLANPDPRDPDYPEPDEEEDDSSCYD